MTARISGTAEQDPLPGLSDLPEGFRYRPDFIDLETERALIGELQKLEFSPFQFHGFEWEHSIPAVAEQRYSITFRSLRNRQSG